MNRWGSYNIFSMTLPSYTVQTTLDFFYLFYPTFLFTHILHQQQRLCYKIIELRQMHQFKNKTNLLFLVHLFVFLPHLISQVSLKSSCVFDLQAATVDKFNAHIRQSRYNFLAVLYSFQLSQKMFLFLLQSSGNYSCLQLMISSNIMEASILTSCYQVNLNLLPVTCWNIVLQDMARNPGYFSRVA